MVEVKISHGRLNNHHLLIPYRIPYWGAADFVTVLVGHQDRTVLPAQIRPHRIELIGKTIGDVGRQHIIRQIPPGEVQHRPLSDQVKMISRHVRTMRRRAARSGRQRDCDSLTGLTDATRQWKEPPE
jgi:hypothetical protein